MRLVALVRVHRAGVQPPTQVEEMMDDWGTPKQRSLIHADNAQKLLIEAYTDAPSRRSPPRCAACQKPFRGDPGANVCNTCAANGNYVTAVFTDSNTPTAYFETGGCVLDETVLVATAVSLGFREPQDALRYLDGDEDGYTVARAKLKQVARRKPYLIREGYVSTDQFEERFRARQQQLTEIGAPMVLVLDGKDGFVERLPTLNELHSAFVRKPPRDETGYIDTSQLEADVARLLEAQGPDWYLQLDEEPELSAYGKAYAERDRVSASMQDRERAVVEMRKVSASIAMIGLCLTVLLAIGGHGVLAFAVGFASLLCVLVLDFLLPWVLIGRWERKEKR